MNQLSTRKSLSKEEIRNINWATVRDRAKNNKKFVYSVGGMLQASGCEVEYVDVDVENPERSSKEGGLIVDGKKVRVKSCNISFTEALDYCGSKGYYPNFIIHNKKSYDTSSPKIDMIIRVNKEMTHVIICRNPKEEKWFSKETTDRARSIPSTELAYFMRTKDALFVPIEKIVEYL